MGCLVALSERGVRVGEDHPKAVLSNREVDMLFELRDAGLSYGALVNKFEVSKSTVVAILKCRRRNVTPAKFVERPYKAPK